jgi:AbrB family looped-hinge helix DNA binding protein
MYTLSKSKKILTMESKIIKVSDKGQISIPIEIRRSAGIAKGDSLLLVQKGGRILMEKPRIEEDFSWMNSDEVAKELWDNEYDKIWDDA